MLRQLRDMSGSFLATRILLRELSFFHTEFRLFIGILRCIMCIFLTCNIVRFASITSYKIILTSTLFSFLVLFNPAVQVRTAVVL
jgi:hypothetical protein